MSAFDPVLSDLAQYLHDLDKEPAIPAERCGWCGDLVKSEELKSYTFNSVKEPQTVRACPRCRLDEANDSLTAAFASPARTFRRWLRSKRRAH